ncbi:hypothetical protein [Reyranella sp.]|uniref:hypothetical protein n=1 Tax=Reyranella sp. TaxID=1929291 RepID=UPI002F925B2C
MTGRGIGRARHALHKGVSAWRWPLPTSLRKVRLRQWTVLAMVIFAVLGAVTAYRGAHTEQDSIVIAERLAQGQLIEVGTRQQLHTQKASASALATRENAVRWEGQALARSAALAREEGRTEEAAWFGMRAQEEFAAARAVRLVRYEFASNSLSTDEENLRVAGSLARLGFGSFVHFDASDAAARATSEPAGSASCRPSSGLELSHLWCETRDRLEELHAHVRTFALAVAAFVLALTLFTVSDASAKARWRALKWVFLGAGLAMGAVAVAVVLLFGDSAVWPWLLGGLVATPVLWLGLHFAVAYAERRGWVHPEKGEGGVHSEELSFERAALRAPILGHHIEHWFGIVTIILVAVTVFLSAAVGWGYSVANTHADAAAEEARKAAAEMVIRTSLFAARQSEVVREVAGAVERRVRLALTHQRLQLSESRDAMKSRYGEEEQRHAHELGTYKGQFANLDFIMDSPTLSVEEDPRFPNRLLWHFLRIPTFEPVEKEKPGRERDERGRNAYEAFAQWDLDSSVSVSWRDIATRLLAALTIFAISLYFLGQALAMEPTRSGYVLLTAGIMFACVGIGSSLYVSYPMLRLAGIAGETPKKVSEILADNECPAVHSAFSDGTRRAHELAAYFYSVGIVLAEYRSDATDLRRSRKYFACALALNPTFAHARLKLADVRFVLGSLDFDEPYISLPVRDELLSKIDGSRSARALLRQSGLDLPAGQRSDLAYDTALDGLIRHDDATLAEAESVARETIDLIETGRMLASPDEATLLYFNLGFVRLARGQFDTARQAYRKGLNDQSGDAIRASALTDLETVKALRCQDNDAAMGAKFDCADLTGAIADIKRTLLARPRADAQTPVAKGIPQQDFSVSVTANHLTARVRGVDAEADDLWLVWSRLEPGWNSWRTLQRISRPVRLGRNSDDGATVRDGMLTVRQSQMHAYSGIEDCLAGGQYRAELYAHGTLIAARPLDQPLPKMKVARLHELNVELCIPDGWRVVPMEAAVERQGAGYGVIRGLQNSAGKLSSFIFTFYVPAHSDELGACLVPRNLVGCALAALKARGYIAGDEPLVYFEDLSRSIDSRSLIVKPWRTPDGGVHVVFARADAASSDQLWHMLESAEVIYNENETDAEEQK